MSQLPSVEKLIKENSQLKAELEAIKEGGGIKIIFPDKFSSILYKNKIFLNV